MMTPAERYRATMEMKPVDRLVRREFGFMEGVLENWKNNGLDGALHEQFHYDADTGQTSIGQLGWVEPAFFPRYERTILHRSPEYDIVRDTAGRQVKFFKGKSSGFMPTYLHHPVSEDNDWHDDVKRRLSPDNPERIKSYDQTAAKIKQTVDQTGNWLTQKIIGQYMYLRALMGPEDVMYAFFDRPELIDDILDQWLLLADCMIERLQHTLELDELFFGEDICYNHGLLISPDLWRRFLKPRYLELIARVRTRQNRTLKIQIDTDGNVAEAIPLYREIGMNIMSPFECAAGNDVITTAQQYPDLVICGGINKQILSRSQEEIEDHLRHIIPFMVKRGGYIPTCDHMVPLEVDLEQYRFYRDKIIELDAV